MTRPFLFLRTRHEDLTSYQRIRLWSGMTSIGTNLWITWALAIISSWWLAMLGMEP